jgi:hypothetical protein
MAQLHPERAADKRKRPPAQVRQAQPVGQDEVAVEFEQWVQVEQRRKIGRQCQLIRAGADRPGRQAKGQDRRQRADE